MLLEFLQTSRSLKERNLHDKSVRIETLSADIDLVNRRKEELAAIQHVTRAVHAPGCSSSAKVNESPSQLWARMYSTKRDGTSKRRPSTLPVTT
jgi:hypothetical protein